jgi:hypothetical protein
LIVDLDGHLVALIDGVIHDTYDSGGAGRRPVKGYWSQAGSMNAADPEASADAMKAAHAKDEPPLAGNDPGPIPESLVRRAAV